MEAALAVKFGGSFRLNKGRQVLHEYRVSTDQLFTSIYRHSFYIDMQFSHQYTYILHRYMKSVSAGQILNQYIQAVLASIYFSFSWSVFE